MNSNFYMIMILLHFPRTEEKMKQTEEEKNEKSTKLTRASGSAEEEKSLREVEEAAIGGGVVEEKGRVLAVELELGGK